MYTHAYIHLLHTYVFISIITILGFIIYFIYYVYKTILYISMHFIGEGNDNPLQYSCLENPIDRGTWGLQSTGLQIVRQNLVIEHGILYILI